MAADLQASLEGLGYEVIGTADTAAEALHLTEQSSPDVVLMDIGLKGSMDGIAAADEIGRQWNTAVVFVTGNTKDETLLQASAARPFGYVLKPFRIKELNATILLALQQQQLARELFSEQTWLRTLLQSLSDGVIATDAEGCVRYINPAGEELSGYFMEDAVGKPIEDIYRLTTMSDEPVELCQLRKALLTRSPLGKSRFCMHSQHGRVIPIEDAASPIHAAGQIIGAVTVFVDVSEQVRRERELKRERERLEEQVQLTTQALGESRAELSALSRHLMRAQEEERRRIARELHDDLNQRAALAEMELDRILTLLPLENESARQIISTVHQRLAELSSGLREVSHRLHPSVVEHLGLAVALRSLVADYRQNGVEATFLTPGQIPDLPLDIATALYRITQEALRNAGKHAKGELVRVSLEQRDQELHLTIQDAGPGFDLSQARAKSGLGLLSMHERARLAGGSLLLRTRPGHGTLILVRVPLRPPEE